MKTLEVTLSDELAAKVERAAEHRGLSVQDLLRSSVVETLERQAEFESAATHVLSKNAELYKRLS